jgi:hypothetical protein
MPAGSLRYSTLRFTGASCAGSVPAISRLEKSRMDLIVV